jgi:hypothetical protein
VQGGLRAEGPPAGAANRSGMRTRQLRSALQAFAEEAAWRLAADTADGAEVPFEVVEQGRRDAPLSCYRPLVGAFVAQRAGVLTGLPSYLPAAHQLAACGGLEAYLEARGERAPRTSRERADAALLAFLSRVFGDSTEFAVHAGRLKTELDDLERLVADGRAETVVAAPLLGLAIDADEVPLGDGLSFVRGDAADPDVPGEAVWAPGAAEPHVLAVLRWEAAAGDAAPVAHARVRLGRLLMAMRLYEAAPFAFGPLAWTRTGAGVWQPFALGATGEPPEERVLVTAVHEDELRAFCSLVTRRTPRSGALAWALQRFGIACEAPTPEQALTDVLLALRALLEPEGPQSGRLARRLAALCAVGPDRAALSERAARAVAAERGVVAGVAPDPGLPALVGDMAGHLRALLRDVLCGHLDADLRVVADRLLEEPHEPHEQPTLA